MVPLHASCRQRVKGKQVEILYELVTVSRERMIFVLGQSLVRMDWEGYHTCGTTSQETCQLPVQEQKPRPRVFGRADLLADSRFRNIPFHKLQDRRSLTQTVNADI